MEYSVFGSKFRRNSGITQLMDDLGAAMAGGDMLMLGGGNPAHIPEVQQQFREHMESILSEPSAFERMVGNYDGTRGNAAFIEALVELMNTSYGWDIGPENVVLTNGSQSAFFYLFNLFAGAYPDGARKKILLPLTPEYIGYADIGLCEDFFQSYRPVIQLLDDHMFKYHVDFQSLEVGEEVGAICVSRPTNPTGNVLTDDEMRHLDELARKNGVPLIIDNAYGTPFPNIIFSEGALFLWLWFEGLRCTSAELYERLKARGCLVVSGHHFFPGQQDAGWPHHNECLRVTYAQDSVTVREGIRVIADEVKRIYLCGMGVK